MFCREIVSKDGDRALLKLEKSDPKLILTFIVPPKAEFGIAAVNLIKKEEWKDDYLKQVPVCIRKGGVCIGIGMFCRKSWCFMKSYGKHWVLRKFC